MEDLKAVIAENIIQLRHSHNMTQAGLAEILNYTDKAVSKWERKESLPDITVLKAIADYFGVTVDYLLTSEHDIAENETTDEKENEKIKVKTKNHIFITGMSVLLVWLIATFIFVGIDAIDNNSHVHWLAYAYAVPISMIVWLVLNSIWFNARRNFIIISFLVWGILLAAYLSVLAAGRNFPVIFMLGIPGQAIIFLWSGIKSSTKK